MPLNFSDIKNKKLEIDNSLTQFIRSKYLEIASNITNAFSDIGELIIDKNMFILTLIDNDLYSPKLFIALDTIKIFFEIDHLITSDMVFIRIIFSPTSSTYEDMLSAYVHNRKNKNSSIFKQPAWLDFKGAKEIAINIRSGSGKISFNEAVLLESKTTCTKQELDFSNFLDKLSEVQRGWVLKNIDSIL